MSTTTPDPIVVAAVGDFMFFDRPDQADLEATRPLLEGADVVIGNIDTVLSDRGTPVPKWANLRATPEIAHDLQRLGIDVAILANNHTMDYRAEAMADALAAYAEAGIHPSGAGKDLNEATAPTILTTPNGTVAILSVCSTLSPEAAAGDDSPGVAPLKIEQSFKVDLPLLAEQPGTPPEVITWPNESDLERVRQDVIAARRRADHVLVAIHWGVPSPWRMPASPVIQSNQRVIGHALIEAGADAVIGNHAHELHGIEFHQGKPILYCLGNFWIDRLDQFAWMGRESMVLRLSLHADGAVGLDLCPLYLDDRGVPRPDAAARAATVLTERSQEFGVKLEERNNRFHVVPPGSPNNG